MGVGIAGQLPSKVDVVVIGAGLSGLTTAHRLTELGLDVAILEARDRAGGRVYRVPSATGEPVDAGAELLGLRMSALIGLAEEFGVGVVPLHAEGKLIRFNGDQRYIESIPYESEPTLGEGHVQAAATLDAMAAEVPLASPWDAPQALEWDSQTLGSWLIERVPDEQVRASLSSEFDYTGASFGELSLLFALWLVHSMGGWEAWTQGTTHRLRGGSGELTDALVSRLEGKIVLEAPVRRVTHAAAGVTVETDRAAVQCRSVVAAIGPVLCGRIDWEPRLPLARDRIQQRYLEGHGIKFVAVYPEPWWRDEGLSGLGIGLAPVSTVADITGPEHSTGRLVGFAPITGDVARRFSPELSDEQRSRQLFLEQAARYLGPRAAEATEVHVFNWVGDPWAVGAGVGLPPGVLSSVGPALREPVGPIHWAGAETGLPQCDWMEGAVAAGERTAQEVQARLLPDRAGSADRQAAGSG